MTTPASQIMANASAAAGIEPAAPPAQAPLSDPGAISLMEQLPGIVGALDTAIKDSAGKPLAFMLIVFTEGAALHATNANASQARAATIEVVQAWMQDGDGPVTPEPASGDAAG